MQLALKLDDEPRINVRVPPEQINPHSYDNVIVAFSGGKDSVACVLHLLEMGIKPQLHHHKVDGNNDNDGGMKWDWPVTEAYCRAFAAAFDLKILMSWREGGLTGELLKENDRTKAIGFETDAGIVFAGGTRGAISTRRRFPQLISGPTRWCTGIAKIDVGAAAIAGNPVYRGKKILVVTGERAEESSARSKYLPFEYHRTHAPGSKVRRIAHHWRPVLDWSEAEIWAIMKRHFIRPHPAYEIGIGRVSCQICIYSLPNALATTRKLDPKRFAAMQAHEDSFGCTIKRTGRISDHADKGVAMAYTPEQETMAMSHDYTANIIMKQWTLPKGAYKGTGGPG